MRKIIHIDMDCFYAAVEMRDNPVYRDIPIAVGGDSPRSVMCTCNYIARQYGVRSAMSAIKAKQLCPQLVIVTPRMAAYKEVSRQIQSIFQRFTHLIEPLSLDEAYLDVTESDACHGSATLIAEEIRRQIFQETGLTASAGVAPNKFIAKIASDENKPNGLCVVSPDRVADFVESLSLKKIPGIGPKTYEKLASYGFENCADVRASSVDKLGPIVGKFAQSLYDKSFGRDDRALTTSRWRKSLAVETTLARDINTMEACSEVVEQLLPKLNQRLIPHLDKRIVKQGIKLKFADFNQTTVEQRSNIVNHALYKDLLASAIERANGRSIRLVGISLGFAEQQAEAESCGQQMSLPMI